MNEVARAVGGVALTAAVDETVRGVAQVVGKAFSKSTTMDPKLEKLEMLIIELRAAAESADNRRNKSQSLCKWQEKLKDAAQEGENFLNAFKNQQGNSTDPSSSLSRVAKRVKVWFSIDEATNQLNSIIEKMESMSSNLPKFIDLLKLEFFYTETFTQCSRARSSGVRASMMGQWSAASTTHDSMMNAFYNRLLLFSAIAWAQIRNLAGSIGSRILIVKSKVERILTSFGEALLNFIRGYDKLIPEFQVYMNELQTLIGKLESKEINGIWLAKGLQKMKIAEQKGDEVLRDVKAHVEKKARIPAELAADFSNMRVILKEMVNTRLILLEFNEDDKIDIYD